MGGWQVLIAGHVLTTGVVDGQAPWRIPATLTEAAAAAASTTLVQTVLAQADFMLQILVRACPLESPDSPRIPVEPLSGCCVAR